MKKLFAFIAILLVLGAVNPSVVIPDVHAQMKDDPAKNTSKMSLWFSKMKSKCEKAMEWVANSQVGQFVGDGIKYTKQGIAFAKEQYEAAMDLYNQTKDSVLNSKEYKAAMISKDIARETAVMKKGLEEKQQKLKELKQQEELVEQQAQAKIANIQSNLNLNEQRMLEDEAKGNLGAEAEVFMSEQEKLLEEIERETAAKLESLKQSAELIEEEFKDKEMESAEKVADLSIKLKDTLDGDGKDKKETRSAREIIQEQQDKLFLKAGEKADLAVERKKKKNRAKAVDSSIDSGMQAAMGEAKQKQSSNKDKVESKAGVANTMTGESEVSGVNTEVIGEQLNIMMSYIRLNLAYIKMNAIAELNNLHELQTSAAAGKFDLCEYTDPENRKSALEMARSKAENAMQKVNKGIAKVNEAKDKVNGLRNKVNEAKDTFNDAAAVAGQLGDVAKETGKSLSGQVAPGMF